MLLEEQRRAAVRERRRPEAMQLEPAAGSMPGGRRTLVERGRLMPGVHLNVALWRAGQLTHSTDGQVTVFVIDDDVSVRDAIKGTLNSIGLRAETFESPRDFIRHGVASGPSCLVLDVRLPGLSGLDFQHELARSKIDLPIVFITGYGDIPMSVRAMKAGAVEFLAKPFRDQDLIDAVQQALERDRTNRRVRSELAQLQSRFESLSERERQVLRLVVAGKLNKEIAAQLGVAEITVKVQRGHVMRKMQAESVVDLVGMVDRLARPGS
jgi:FixJ family two-component response regulator